MMVLPGIKVKKRCACISFMRDIYADIPGYKSYKLNTAYYLNGVQTNKRYNHRDVWHSYSSLRHCGLHNFESIVDIAFPKGVEIDVKKEMSEKIGVTLMPGKKKLNGQELLAMQFPCRCRRRFRTCSRQQEVISAMKDEAIRPGMIVMLRNLRVHYQGSSKRI